MDTQNTPVHIKLWHKDFWRLCFANLLLMSSVYMLVFAIPYFLIQENFQQWQIGCVLLAYGLGLFLFGGFCSYLVQRYRRNMVCQLSILGVVVCLSVLYYLDTFWNIRFPFEILLAVRFLLGAFLGLAQMTLASTLVIDSCESFQRTEANYITSWFARFSIAVGPLLAFLFTTISAWVMFSLRLRCWLWEPSCWFLAPSFLLRRLPKESRFSASTASVCHRELRCLSISF